MIEGQAVNTGAGMEMSKLAPGYDGEQAVEIALRDPDGDGRRTLTTITKLDILDYLLKRGVIHETHLTAAKRLRSDAKNVSGRPTTVNMDGTSSGAYRENAAVLEAVEASRRLKRILAIFEPADEIFLLAVVVNGYSLKSACRFAGWHQHSGSNSLRLILWALAREYGLAS